MAETETADAQAETQAEDTYTQLEQKHYQEIVEKEREVDRHEAVYLASKDTTSAAKKVFEASDAALRRLIREGADPQLTLLGMTESDWRELPLADLGIDGALAERFGAVDVETIGGLSEWIAEHGEGWWRGGKCWLDPPRSSRGS